MLQLPMVDIGDVFPVYKAMADSASPDSSTTCPDCPSNLPIILNVSQAVREIATLTMRWI